MCRPAKCGNEGCGKTTWQGCGAHVASVMAPLQEEEKCKCPAEDHNPTQG